MRNATTTCIASAIVTVASFQALDAHAQPQRIRAVDGDTVVINGDARVNIVRSRSAHIRAVFNADEHWLIVLARLNDRQQLSTGVDEAFMFREVDGPWSLGARWEGDASVETYSAAGESGGPAGYGLRTSAGLVQLFSKDSQRFGTTDVSERFVDPDGAAIIGYRGWGRSSENGAAFDAVERAKVAEAKTGRSRATVSGGVIPSGATPDVGVVRNPSPSPIRKINDVQPMWPEAARQANVRGVVIVELTIGTDGRVTDVSILRGIPLLNDAALDCVRQWQYEAVMLNGHPIPMHFTATVTFP
jgi:TonB family protein